ncbi:type IV pilus modification protein PilV [Pseudomonas sp. LS44]|uniref:type IV pilus modification protein PilV n=1 Tax=Pseudomonas sp. LS44 TaxID=1357074 RepID=UPI00215B6661|nr:type IV pilus modification protein PilV [Pseudomonas sp. LS44]UVE18497.1 type IV pilus modification protein PilV [Pseudomonas sp. LS44]
MKSTQGFSMVEVLITLLLVSIGVLGMVAMQSRTIQYTQDSIQRNAAAALANDLLELIRAQPAGLPASSGFYKAAAVAFPAVPTAGCGGTPQSPQEQLACWAQKAGKLLPGVTTSLLTSDFYVCRTTSPGTCSANAGSAVEIQLAWKVKAGDCMDSSNSNDSTSTTCHYRLRSDI